jgi:hypothetical protein
MPPFLRQSFSRKFCRGALSIMMAFWLTLTTIGVSSVGGVSSVAGSPEEGQCSCDVQIRRSNNCCCHQKISCCQRKTSCCTVEKRPKSQPQQDDPSETPQFNTFCGTSVPAGAIINREPRLNMASLVSNSLSPSGQSVEILDDILCGSTKTVDLPPPKV